MFRRAVIAAATAGLIGAAGWNLSTHAPARPGDVGPVERGDGFAFDFDPFLEQDATPPGDTESFGRILMVGDEARRATDTPPTPSFPRTAAAATHSDTGYALFERSGSGDLWGWVAGDVGAPPGDFSAASVLGSPAIAGSRLPEALASAARESTASIGDVEVVGAPAPDPAAAGLALLGALAVMRRASPGARAS